MSNGQDESEGPPQRAHIRESWQSNAGAWTDAVRNGHIPSRRLGTDVAIVAACERILAGKASAHVLDVGCGEGWLSRRLASPSAQVVGVDASRALVDAARATPPNRDDAAPRYDVLDYEELRNDPSRVEGPFDLIVCNYALLDDALAATLSGLRARLDRDGSVVVQTVHPWVAAGDGPYEDGWRLETFTSFERPFPSTMPWYFYTLESWLRAIQAAGLKVSNLEEPLHPETRRPLSLLITARHAPNTRLA
jgi:2-polyprenyl-3-methyl-5-hydroxy-6-metoxy-1,4-benzoquinol methylase